MNLMLRAAAEVVGLALGVLSTLWVSRAVGPSYFGYYAVMVTVITFGGLFINAGQTTVGSQRVANDPSSAATVLWAVTVSRAAIAFFAILASLSVLAIAPIDPILRAYLRVGLIVWATIPIANGWVFVAKGRLRLVSALRVAGSVATLATSVIFIHGAADYERVAWVPLASPVLTGLTSSVLAYKDSPFGSVSGMTRLSAITSYLRSGIHYLKADLSTFIFTSSDRLFLYAFATPAVVGLYAAAYSVIQPFYMISAVIGDAMYLPLARAYGTDRLKPVFRRYVDMMCFATIPLGFFLMVFSPVVISILYGSKYAGAAQYLSVLGWVITFGYTSGIAVLPFSAWNRPREYGNSTASGGVANLILNFGLIPTFGGFGAAWATVAAKATVTIAGVRYFRRAAKYPLVRDFAEYFVLSGIAMAVGSIGAEVAGAGIGLAAFGMTYVVLVASARWRYYGTSWPISPRAAPWWRTRQG